MASHSLRAFLKASAAESRSARASVVGLLDADRGLLADFDVVGTSARGSEAKDANSV